MARLDATSRRRAVPLLRRYEEQQSKAKAEQPEQEGREGGGPASRRAGNTRQAARRGAGTAMVQFYRAGNQTEPPLRSFYSFAKDKAAQQDSGPDKEPKAKKKVKSTGLTQNL
jgi:hypothetical protein